MAQNRNVEVIAELRTAAAETRASISTTVNAIEDRLSTVVADYLPDGRGNSIGSNARSLTRSLASVTAARVLARRFGGKPGSASRITTLAIVGVVFGFLIWLNHRRPPTLRSRVQERPTHDSVTA